MHPIQPRRLVILVMIFTAGLWMTASSMFGQAHNGNIFGRTVEKGGQILPGVTVTLTGIGAPQIFVTDSQGQFRFLSLAPGSYSVLAELEGFSKVRRRVDVTVGRNSDIDLVLSAAVRETITVTAATPILDRRQVGTAANIEQIELDKVPTARDPWVLLQSVPGVLVDRVNVGGNKSGQQSYFVGKGVERSQTVWNIDGVSSTDMSAGGGMAGFYLDFESFQEFNVVTGSADPSVQTPGVQLNMVTKRGTNDIKGTGRFLWTSDALQTDPKVPAEGAQYGLTTVNSINRISEAGAEMGGPVISDKLWMWGAYSRNPIDAVVSGSSKQYQKTDLWNWNGKINAQLTGQNSAFLGYMYSNKQVEHRSIGPTRPVETSVNQTGPGWQWTAEDTHIFNSSLYLTGRVGWIKNGYNLVPVGGLDTQAYYDAKGIPHGSYQFFYQSMPQRQVNVEGSQFVNAGDFSHQLKFGFGYRRTPVKSSSGWPGDGTIIRNDYGEVEITRNANPSYQSIYKNLYVGDTLTNGNLTIMGGVRYDFQQARNNGASVPANPAFPDLLPAATFPGDTRSLEWKAVAPRVGITYALGESKRTLLRAGYGRYSDQLSAGSVGSNNPFYNIQVLWYYWTDLNGDGKPQKSEFTSFDLASYVDPNNPASPTSTGRVDYGMRPPKTDEYLLGVEREIGNAFAVGANFTHRKRTNLVWTAYEKTKGGGDFYTPNDFSLTTPITGTLPNGESYSVPFYKLNSNVPKPLYTVTTNRPDYYQTYDSLELTATKRMLDNWMLRGNVTFSDWKKHSGPGSVWNPTRLISTPTGGYSASCDTCEGSGTVASAGGANGYINSRWSASVNGVYQFPHQITLGAALTGREGYVLPYYRRVRDSRYGNVRVLIDDFDSFRLPNLYQVDLRVAKNLALPRGVGLEVSADLFNALNAQTVLWRDNRLYSSTGTDLGAGNNNIQELQSPRIWRVGARISF